MKTPEQSISPAQQKINEYAERIRKGADPAQVMQGLGANFRDGIEKRLLELENQDIKNNPQSQPEIFIEKVPDQAQVLQEQQKQERLAREQEQIEELRNQLGAINKEESNPLDNIQNKIKDDLNNLSFDELKEQVKLQHDRTYWERRGSLSDDLFIAGKGKYFEDKQGNSYQWESVSGEIGQHFDAHGISKTEQLSSLLNLLEKGIDKSKDFYTAPFEIPEEYKAGVGAAVGTGDGTAYKDGIAVLVSAPDKRLKENGIKYVFLNDVYQNIREPLAKAFPQYEVYLLSEQKSVLESDFKEYLNENQDIKNNNLENNDSFSNLWKNDLNFRKFYEQRALWQVRNYNPEWLKRDGYDPQKLSPDGYFMRLDGTEADEMPSQLLNQSNLGGASYEKFKEHILKVYLGSSGQKGIA